MTGDLPDRVLLFTHDTVSLCQEHPEIIIEMAPQRGERGISNETAS